VRLTNWPKFSRNLIYKKIEARSVIWLNKFESKEIIYLLIYLFTFNFKLFYCRLWAVCVVVWIQLVAAVDGWRAGRGMTSSLLPSLHTHSTTPSVTPYLIFFYRFNLTKEEEEGKQS
jgi:hypothetical protein